MLSSPNKNVSYPDFSRGRSTSALDNKFFLAECKQETLPVSVQTVPEIDQILAATKEFRRIMREQIIEYRELDNELLLSSLINKYASKKNAEKIMRVLYSISDADISNRIDSTLANGIKKILLRASIVILSNKSNPVIDIFSSEDGNITMSASLINKFITLVISKDSIILGFTKKKRFWSKRNSFVEEFKNNDISLQDLLVRLNKIV